MPIQPCLKESSKPPANQIQCKVIDLGLVDYLSSYKVQREILNQVKNKATTNTILLCEHLPVITLGRLANKKNVLIPRNDILKKGIQLVNSDRGGDTTFHGPGQLVAYPILDLKSLKMKDLKKYLYTLENIIINVLSRFNIKGCKENSLTGVWAERKKIASIGISVRNWITYHGLALNVNTDLSYFSMIKPCGLDTKITSMSEIIGRNIETKEVKQIFIDTLAKFFNLCIIK